MDSSYNKVSVLLVDDDNDFASLFSRLISADSRLVMVGAAPDKEIGVELACLLYPDVVVMDLNLSGVALDGIEAAREIRVKTGSRILLLTAYEGHDTIVNASEKAFASGYVFKSHFRMIADIVYETATSKTPQKELIRELILRELSPAERSIFNDILNGAISGLAYQSASTIANQKTSIFKKLGLKNTKELIKVFSNW